MDGRRFVGPGGLVAFNASVRDTLVSQTITAPDTGRFRADLVAADVSRSARVVVASIGPLGARRGRDQARRAEGSVFLLACDRGRGEIRHAGGVETIAPGRLVVVPGAEPFDVTYPVASRVVFVALPQPEVATRYAGLDGPIRSHGLDPVARRVSGRWGELATMATGIDHPSDRQDLAAVLEATLHLALRRTIGDTAGDPLVALRVEAHRLIDRHLTAPALSPAWLAKGLGVSVRQLHRAFEGTGHPVAATIRSRRLAACARALHDPDQRHRSVTELALAFGFSSPSHLSTWFREEYGMTPTQWRSRGWHGSGEVPARA